MQTLQGNCQKEKDIDEQKMHRMSSHCRTRVIYNAVPGVKIKQKKNSGDIPGVCNITVSIPHTYTPKLYHIVLV